MAGPEGANANLSTSRWSPTNNVSSIDPVGITKACTKVVVPNSNKIMVTVHSAINPRCSGSFFRVVWFVLGNGGLIRGAFSANSVLGRSTILIVALPQPSRKRHLRADALLSCTFPPDTHDHFPTRNNRGKKAPIGLYGPRLHGFRGRRASSDEIRRRAPNAQDRRRFL